MSQHTHNQPDERWPELIASLPVETRALRVIGAIDWRLDGYLSGVGVLPGPAQTLGLWSLRLRRGRALCFWQPARNTCASSMLSPLIASDGRPWLGCDLMSALCLRWHLPQSTGAVLCTRGTVVYMAVPLPELDAVVLHRFEGDAHVSWRLALPSPGRLVQLFVFGDHAALVDVPQAEAQGDAPCESRLMLCQLADGASPICTIKLDALCHPGIVNAYASRGHCVIDIALADVSGDSEHGLLWRCLIAAQGGVLSKSLLARNNITDATVHPGLSGFAQRFAYLSCFDAKSASAGLCRLDLTGPESEWCTVPFGQYPHGLAVVGASRGDSDLSTWLATILHDRANDSSKILLAPAKALAKHQSVAIRMPAGMTLGKALLWTAWPPLQSPDSRHVES